MTRMRSRLGTLLLALLALAACPLPAHAALKSGTRNVEEGEIGQGGGSYTGGKFRQSYTVGGAIRTTAVVSSRFTINSGFTAATSSSAKGAPLTNLGIPLVYAKASGFGAEIPPQTWQGDADPLFIWQTPSAGLDLAGYSWAVDAAPDTTVDTTATSVDLATTSLQRLADGVHTFSVQAIDSAGRAGTPKSIELWVDTTPPVVGAYAPAGEALLNAAPPLSATVSDAHSGVDNAAVEVFINGQRVQGSVDPGTGSFTATSAAWREGVNTLELRAADLVGNALTPVIWSVSLDTQPPVGTILINGGAGMTTSMYVTLAMNAQDQTSGLTRMLISNQRTAGFVEEPYAAVRQLWGLTPVRGRQTVYVKFMDRAGNVSPAVSDDIEVSLLSPDTVITNGPAGVTPLPAATFSFMCPDGGCRFAYAFDNAPWSAWAPATTAIAADLPPGNHYFRVKAAKDVNGLPGIQPDEEDPTPAERTWIIGAEPTIFAVPKGPPIKLWRLE